MTTNNLINVLTQIDITGPSVDVTALVPNNSSDKRGSGDSEYRDALARSLSESNRRDSLEDEKRTNKDGLGSSRRSTDRAFKAESPKIESNRFEASESQKKQPKTKSTDDKTQPLNSQSVLKSENEANLRQPAETQVPTKDVEHAIQDDSNGEPSAEQLFEIKAQLGTPPAQFQPITISSSLNEGSSNGSETLNSSETSGLLPEDIVNLSFDSDLPESGYIQASAIIEDLIDPYELIIENRDHANSGQPIPPTGLFHAPEDLNKGAENASNSTRETETELISDLAIGEPIIETEINSDLVNPELKEEIAFETTLIDVSVGIETTVTSKNPSYGDDADQADSANQLLSVSELVASEKSNVTITDPTRDKTTEEIDLNQDLESPVEASIQERSVTVSESLLPVEQANQQAQVESSRRSSKTNLESGKAPADSSGLNEISVESIVVPSILATTGSEVIVSESTAVENTVTGTSHVQVQNSAETPDEQLGSLDKTGLSGKSTKSSATRTEVNPQKVINKVAEAVRTVSRGGQQLRIQLSPPELGTVQIEISARSGVVTARIEVQTSAAHQTMTENIALLRETLAQNGTKLDHIDVHLNDHWQGDGESEMTEQQSDQQSQENYHQDDSDESSTESDPENQMTAVGGASEIEQLDIQI